MALRPFRFTFVLSLATLLFALAAPDAQAKDTLVLLDGQAIEGNITGIDDAGNVLYSGRDGSVSLQDLRRINRSVKVAQQADGIRIYLTDGSELTATRAKVEAATLTIDWTAGKAMTLPLASVRAIMLPWDQKDKDRAAFAKDFAAAVQSPDPARDGLFVPRDGKLTEVRGALDALGQDDVTFIWNDKPRKIDRSRIFGLVLAAATDPPDLTGQVRVTLREGSTIWGRATALADGKLKLTRIDGIKLELPWADVGQLSVRSDRMVFLSDLTPIRQRSSGIATLPTWPIELDRSVMGNPITLKGKVYERGLGTHANASIVYAVGRYDVLAATIGIDDETQGRGDCIFKVLVDGDEKFSQRMRAKDKPRTIRVAVTDASRVELIVEAGEDLDLADHADWADARLIRE